MISKDLLILKIWELTKIKEQIEIELSVLRNIIVLENQDKDILINKNNDLNNRISILEKNINSIELQLSDKKTELDSRISEESNFKKNNLILQKEINTNLLLNNNLKKENQELFLENKELLQKNQELLWKNQELLWKNQELLWKMQQIEEKYNQINLGCTKKLKIIETKEKQLKLLLDNIDKQQKEIETKNIYLNLKEQRLKDFKTELFLNK